MLLLLVHDRVIFRYQFVVLGINSFFEVVDRRLVEDYGRGDGSKAGVFFQLRFGGLLLEGLLHDFARFSSGYFHLRRAYCLHRLSSFPLLLRGNLSRPTFLSQIFLYHRI